MSTRGLFRVEIEDNQFRVLLNTAKLGLSDKQLRQLGLGIRDLALRVQSRAVRNVSGYPVQYNGQVFRVVVRTGALKASIHQQWPYQSPLQARVYVNGAYSASAMILGGVRIQPQPVAAYAAAIEYGHGEIDLKKFMLGKTVPFFASRGAKSTGPFAVRGLEQIGDSDFWQNEKFNQALAAKGKGPMIFHRRQTHPAYEAGKRGGSSYYIAFRKVGKKGWIIPAARPRPFMRAALKQTERDVPSVMGAQVVQMLNPESP